MLSEKRTETYFKQTVEDLYENDGICLSPTMDCTNKTFHTVRPSIWKNVSYKTKTSERTICPLTANITETGTPVKNHPAPA